MPIHRAGRARTPTRRSGQPRYSLATRYARSHWRYRRTSSRPLRERGEGPRGPSRLSVRAGLGFPQRRPSLPSILGLAGCRMPRRGLVNDTLIPRRGDGNPPIGGFRHPHSGRPWKLNVTTGLNEELPRPRTESPASGASPSAGRAEQSGLGDERLEEPLVVVLHLGMPEHSKCEPLRRILDRLKEGAVLGERALDEPRPDTADSLMMSSSTAA